MCLSCIISRMWNESSRDIHNPTCIVSAPLYGRGQLQCRTVLHGKLNPAVPFTSPTGSGAKSLQAFCRPGPAFIPMAFETFPPDRFIESPTELTKACSCSHTKYCTHYHTSQLNNMFLSLVYNDNVLLYAYLL